MITSKQLILSAAAMTSAAFLSIAAVSAQQAQAPQQPQQQQGMQGGGMPMMGMMKQMNEMMETCNKMMQSHMSDDGGSASQPNTRK